MFRNVFAKVVAVSMILAASILVAFLASFFPVKKIASKKPIDAIRDR